MYVMYTEHFKHCDKCIVHFLAMCLTWYSVPGFWPSNLVSVVLVPIIKDMCDTIKKKQRQL